MLTFKRSNYHGGYVAEMPNGDFYHVQKAQRILLGRFGGGTVHTFWRADLVTPGADRSPGQFARRTAILIGSKYAPDHFTHPLGDTKKLAVIACEAHADGAENENK